MGGWRGGGEGGGGVGGGGGRGVGLGPLWMPLKIASKTLARGARVVGSVAVRWVGAVARVVGLWGWEGGWGYDSQGGGVGEGWWRGGGGGGEGLLEAFEYFENTCKGGQVVGSVGGWRGGRWGR